MESTPLTSCGSSLPSFSTRCGSREGQRAGKSWEEMSDSASLSWARTRGGADSMRSVMCALIWSCGQEVGAERGARGWVGGWSTT